MIKAIGFLELISIAKGIEAADAMLKAAQVQMYLATPTCPGKYIVFIYGDVASVEDAMKAGRRAGGEYLVDDLVIPNVEEQIFAAITCTTTIDTIAALGVIECLSMASLIMAADASTKEANVQIVEIRLGTGLGGKSFVVLTGDVADVKTAVQSGVEAIKETGNVVDFTVIPSPHKDFKKLLL
ncbi:MAG: BMC domain-containing protein [Coriobacteriia bacterium]|nr:BMC domain-containing protein [Coriobacteriia bacterium]